MKKLFALVTLFLGLTASACWYQYSFHTDYIASVNDNIILVTNQVNGLSHYTVTNNLVVDLPLTVSVKLLSNTTIKNYDGHISNVGNIIRSSLQYRVLPDGEWVTVVNYNTKMDEITEAVPPKTYFGKNNIYPRGLKPGTAIMIRVYVTDGEWQSGDISSKCSDLLTNVTTKFGTVTSMPNVMSYYINALDLLDVDLGGAWYPHLCFTVIYSGNERPIR